jgi:hypothetical protein
VASGHERGRPLANAAVELPDKDHSARRVSRPLRPRSGTASFNFTVPPRWQSRKCWRTNRFCRSKVKGLSDRHVRMPAVAAHRQAAH